MPRLYGEFFSFSSPVMFWKTLFDKDVACAPTPLRMTKRRDDKKERVSVEILFRHLGALACSSQPGTRVSIHRIGHDISYSIRVGSLG